MLPLLLYFLSYVLAFSGCHFRLKKAWSYGISFSLALCTLLLFNHAYASEVLVVQLMVFFLACCFYHFRLYATKPSLDHLTVYYLCISIGGALGGLFNALFAPIFFTDQVEYGLVMILSVYLVYRLKKSFDNDVKYIICLLYTSPSPRDS